METLLWRVQQPSSALCVYSVTRISLSCMITATPVCVCSLVTPHALHPSDQALTPGWLFPASVENSTQIYHASAMSPISPMNPGLAIAWLPMHRWVWFKGGGVREVCIFLSTHWQRDMKMYLFLSCKRRPLGLRGAVVTPGTWTSSKPHLLHSCPRQIGSPPPIHTHTHIHLLSFRLGLPLHLAPLLGPVIHSI